MMHVAAAAPFIDNAPTGPPPAGANNAVPGAAASDEECQPAPHPPSVLPTLQRPSHMSAMPTNDSTAAAAGVHPPQISIPCLPPMATNATAVGGAQPVSAALQQQRAVFNMMSMLASMPGFNIPGMPGVEKHVQSAAPDTRIPANETLYVNNLNDRVKTEQLSRELKVMFSNFGTVEDIVAMKSFWRRGQAWIVFADQESATNAMNGLQGFEFHGKPMRINYALCRSDFFTKKDGTYVERVKGPKRPRAIVSREARLQRQIQNMLSNPNDPSVPGGGTFEGEERDGAVGGEGETDDAHAADEPSGPPGLTDGGPGRLPLSLPFGPNTMFDPNQVMMSLPPMAAQGIGHTMGVNPMSMGGLKNSATPPGGHPHMTANSGAMMCGGAGGQTDKAALVAAAAAQAAEALQTTKKRRFDVPSGSPVVPTAKPPGMFPFGFQGPPAWSGGGSSSGSGFRAVLPNETLFAEDLPEDCTHATLEALLNRFAGFVEVRHIASRRVAFIEFETQTHAAAAMAGMSKFEFVPGVPLKLSYAKR